MLGSFGLSELATFISAGPFDLVQTIDDGYRVVCSLRVLITSLILSMDPNLCAVMEPVSTLIKK